MFYNKRKSIRQFGFSLVEMSVVLAAVAAVTVVTMGGSALVQRSRLGGIVNDVKGFSQALEKFQDKYNGLPGDIVTVTSLPGATGGNGNGAIDAAEALQFWKQLAIAGLIKGHYDGTSLYIPGLGVPEGSIKGSGYNVLDPTANSLSSQAVVIEIAGFSSSSNSLPILTPEDAKAIDDRLDDGNPNTGIVRAVATDSGTGGNCVSNGKYNLTNKTVSCRLRFIIRKSGQANDSVSLSGDGSGNSCDQPGVTRTSNNSTDVCPVGTVGKVLQTCKFNESGSAGVWKVTETHCEPVTCYGGKKYNDTRVIPCMTGQKGSGIVQTCSAEGVWVNYIWVNGVWTSSSTNCTPDDSIECYPNVNGDIRVPQACNWGQKGSIVSKCSLNTTLNKYTWNNSPSGIISNTCTPITCSSSSGNVNVGDTVTSSGGCGIYYTGTTNQTCAMDGSMMETSNKCVPNYSALPSCSSGATQDMGCPPGETGHNIQKCIVTNKWVPISNTCTKITCSGERLGSARVLKDSVCPTGAGVVIEVCTTDAGNPPKGVWKINYSHCAANMCPVAVDSTSNTTWSYAIAGTSGVSGSCTSGYYNALTPTRDCNSNATWGSTITNSCLRQTCPVSFNNATWPSTQSLITNVSGQCNWPNYEGMAIANCDAGAATSANGSWTNVSACSASQLHTIASTLNLSNLNLWLDAADYSTLYNDTACSSHATSGGAVSCWKDKSGHANDAKESNNYPLYNSTGLNSKPSVYFDGSKSSLSVANTSVVSADTDISIILAYKYYNSGYILDFSSSNKKYMYVITNSVGGTGIFGINNTNSVASETTMNFNNNTASTFKVLSILYNKSISASRAVHVNGSSVMTSTPNGNPVASPSDISPTTSNIIGWSGNGNNYLRADIGEIIIYNGVIGGTDLTNVETYLTNKWQ